MKYSEFKVNSRHIKVLIQDKHLLSARFVRKDSKISGIFKDPQKKPHTGDEPAKPNLRFIFKGTSNFILHPSAELLKLTLGLFSK